ncbi:MAG: 6,7-dimethyl-8-ribityllumazine synthase [Candidatus Micrarchaeota archaeon]|nr:6,7-dimethyl-8-ribityllumazine synthase [Candidatus Micrarchaeota archaeon]
MTKKLRIGIAVAQFNPEITAYMLREATAHAKRNGAQVKAIIRVPGAFELPFAVMKLLSRKDIDAAVAIGAVIKGETKHDEAIVFGISKALALLQIKARKPVGFGILGPGITWKQAEARKKEHAQRSVEAAIWMCGLSATGKTVAAKKRTHKK